MPHPAPQRVNSYHTKRVQGLGFRVQGYRLVIGFGAVHALWSEARMPGSGGFSRFPYTLLSAKKDPKP